jgi:cytochrome P450
MVNLWRQYGDAVRFHFFGPFYGYLFVHPDHNKHILQDNNSNYTKQPHPSNVLLRPLVGDGLLTNDGEAWRQQRRLAQPAFHRKRIAEFGITMTDAAQNVLEHWDGLTDQERPLDIAEEMSRVTLEVVGKTLFSQDLTREAETVGKAFSAVNETFADLSARPFSVYTIRLPWWPSTRFMADNIAILDEVVNDIIAQRRANQGQHNDLLDMLMAARDEETGQGMSDRQLRDEVMTILLAGHETTALALSWAFYLLDQNPPARQKLEAELTEVLGGRVPTMADLPQLTYTSMVIDEVLRLYPPAYATARWCNQADMVGGYHVPANSTIALSPYLTHRHPDFWHNPESFDPERFTPERKAERPRYAYIPFGGGPRQCIGNNFALMEAILILATIAQRYRLHLQPGHQVALQPLVTLRPLGGLPMYLARRA